MSAWFLDSELSTCFLFNTFITFQISIITVNHDFHFRMIHIAVKMQNGLMR